MHNCYFSDFCGKDYHYDLVTLSLAIFPVFHSNKNPFLRFKEPFLIVGVKLVCLGRECCGDAEICNGKMV